jgi:CO/xanthine dehydrogenase Mo-binding subunit
VAVWEEDRLTVYDATQWVGGHQRNLAAVLGVDVDRVRVLCPFVGGAFGCKGSMWMHSPLTAAAAKVLNRPVKTVLTRGEIHGNGKSSSFDRLLTALGRSAIEAIGSAALSEEEEAQSAFDSFGAQFCEVKVHDLTAEVRVNRFSGVMDIGTVVSEKTARSQIIGGIVWHRNGAFGGDSV